MDKKEEEKRTIFIITRVNLKRKITNIPKQITPRLF